MFGGNIDSCNNSKKDLLIFHLSKLSLHLGNRFVFFLEYTLKKMKDDKTLNKTKGTRDPDVEFIENCDGKLSYNIVVSFFHHLYYSIKGVGGVKSHLSFMKILVRDY